MRKWSLREARRIVLITQPGGAQLSFRHIVRQVADSKSGSEEQHQMLEFGKMRRQERGEVSSFSWGVWL